MIRSCLLLLSATLLLSGCSRPSYINVPNDGSDTAINGPNWSTTIKIEKAALAMVLADSQLPGDVELHLPEGTKDRFAYDIVSDLSRFNVFPEGEAPTAEFHVVEVREISARGTSARVDIIRPGTIREREFVEVHLSLSIWDGWVAKRLRVRNIPVDRLAPLKLTAPAGEPKDTTYLQPETSDAEALEIEDESAE